MPRIHGLAFCPACDHRTAVHRNRPRHLLHLGLSVLSAGVWLPVWVILGLRAEPWRCRRCDTRVNEPVTPALRPARRFFRGRFAWYRELSPWTFLVCITLESLLVSVAAAIIVRIFIREPELDVRIGLGPLSFFVMAVLVAPVLETLFCQTLPIAIVRRLRGPFALQVLVSTALFGGLHFLEGIGVGVAAGLVGGFYLAFAYAHWSHQSHWTAFWVTAGSHALHNYALFLILALAGKL